VPKGSSDGPSTDSETAIEQNAPIPRWRPRPSVRPAFQLGAGSPTDKQTADGSNVAPLITTVFQDNFDREQLGDEYTKTSDHWEIAAGHVCAQSARNHPVWLNLRLPTNARISFTARTFEKDGDLKVEAWGSGRSFAHGLSYSDATSYLFIFGGWKNRLHVLARLNEHGQDRRELALSPTAESSIRSPVEPNRDYRFVIERKDGRTVTWSVNNEPLLSYEDPEPLKGQSHDHFGFNDWETRVCFDDLVITPLGE
jgi:hypothetical protein